MDKTIFIGSIILLLLIISIISFLRFIFGTGEMDMGFRILFSLLMIFTGWIVGKIIESV
jgi:hypothetical protein